MLEFKELNIVKDSSGLVPAVIQDYVTLQVLMLGYMDEAAYTKSISEGKVTFFSRSRGGLWTKGETSGNYFDIVSVAADCDADTLLIKVRPHGPACHNGTKTCFDGDSPEHGTECF